MTKKENSSGAEKAEKLTSGAKENQEQNERKEKTSTTKKSAPVKSTQAKTVKNNTSKKSAAAKAKKQQAAKDEQKQERKLESAKIKAEKKQKRLERKLEHKQRRLEKLAALKEKRAERKAQRQERKDMLKNESRAEREERKREERALRIEAKVAKRKAKTEERIARREHRLRLKQEKRERASQKNRTPGFGGWLAAVISLGVTTLALGTIVAYGWVGMNGIRADMADIQFSTLYELNSVVDNLDGNLAKARVATSSTEQAKLLSDIAIESEMAEVLLERMPVQCNMTESMASFINKMSDSSKQMLYAVASGESLSESQKATIEHMYQTNLDLKRKINELSSTSCVKDMLAALSGKEGLVYQSFDDIQNNTIETPKEIQDGPFAENKEQVNVKALDGESEITAPEAERLARDYFAKYSVNDVNCSGEATFHNLSLFNVEISTDDGDMFAQISKLGGKVVLFESHKDCEDKNFSVERCIDIATDFLSDLGFDNMTAVWTSENGTVCNLNFAYEQDGVIIYPDIIKVKVCEERGLVTGIEACSYVLNHSQRSIEKAAISKDEALSSISGDIAVKGTRLAVIPLNGEEVLTYEVYGSYGGCDYYLYIDAATGEQVETITVVGTKQGRALM